jgi:phospholipase C
MFDAASRRDGGFRYQVALAAIALAAGCAPQSVAPPPVAAGAQQAERRASSVLPSPIKHVVIIIQENRSFDNLFQGFPGANTAASGLVSNGQQVTLAPQPLEARFDLTHGLADYLNGYDGGKMDGFDQEKVLGKATGQYPMYAYVPRSETALYFELAQQYVLSDNTFASNLDDSFVAHQYLIAGQANSAVDLPTGIWGCDGLSGDEVGTITHNRQTGGPESPCFDSNTLGDELDARGLAWRFYAPTIGTTGGIWSAYQAINHIRNGPEWATNIISPQTNVLTDIKNGTLGAVTWVVPSWRDSDHPASKSKTGPAWVASVVNAVGESPFWNSTAIFVIWDDWGGWYDHVPPPQLDYDGLGFRVPMLVISPYSRRGRVSHVQFESASILRFAEDTFSLPPMAAADGRATDPAGDCLDFTQAPLPFRPIATGLRDADFLNEPRSSRAPDDD